MKTKLSSKYVIMVLKLAFLFIYNVQATYPQSFSSPQQSFVAELESRHELDRVLSESKKPDIASHEPPSISAEPLLISRSLSDSKNIAADDWDLVVNYTDAEDGHMMGLSVALSADGRIAAVGGKNRVSLYTIAEDGGGWSKLTGDLCRFIEGKKIALSSDGQHLIIGNPERNKAQVFSNDNNWKQVGADLNNNAYFGSFGSAVDISDDGEKVAVGDEYYAFVKVYNFTTGEWILEGELKGDEDVGFDSKFGCSISMTGYGTLLAVGDYVEGLTYIFDLKQFFLFQKVYGDCFGNSVAISSDGMTFATSRVCEKWYEESVRAYFYDSESKRYQQFDTSQGGFIFGASAQVSLSGDGTTIATVRKKGEVEKVFLHKLLGGVWTKTDSFDDGISLQVSLSYEGTLLAIGAPYTKFGTSNSTDYNGHVRVYEQANQSRSSLNEEFVQSQSLSFYSSSSSVDNCSYYDDNDDWYNDDWYVDWWWPSDDWYDDYWSDDYDCGVLGTILYFITLPCYLIVGLITAPFQLLFAFFFFYFIWGIII